MARLPIPGSDDQIWGGILNEFLDVEHNPDGTLKRGNDITTALDTANSAQATADSKINLSVLAVKGDLITATAANTPARLAAGGVGHQQPDGNRIYDQCRRRPRRCNRHICVVN